MQGVALYGALHRPDQIAGCERELFLALALIVTVLVMVAMNWLAALVGAVLWVVGMWVLRMMAKTDAVMSKVYRRHIRYQAYYPARSTPFCRDVDYKNK